MRYKSTRAGGSKTPGLGSYASSAEISCFRFANCRPLQDTAQELKARKTLNSTIRVRRVISEAEVIKALTIMFIGNRPTSFWPNK